MNDPLFFKSKIPGGEEGGLVHASKVPVTRSHVSSPGMTSTYLRLTAPGTRSLSLPRNSAVFMVEPDRCTDSSILAGPITFTPGSLNFNPDSSWPCENSWKKIHV